MSSTHFDAAMRAAVVEEARSVWSGARAKAEARAGRRWMMTFAGALALVLVGRWIQGSPEGARSRVAFGRETVVSAQSQGLGSGVEAVLPREELNRSGDESGTTAAAATAPEGAPGVTSTPTPTASPSPKCAACEAAAKARAARAAKSRIRTLDVGDQTLRRTPVPDAHDVPGEEDVFEEDPASQPSTAPSPEPSPRGPTTLNVGSQFDIVLDLPVVTGAATAPVVAHAASEVTVGDVVAIPAGSRVVGEAFATFDDDRVQVVLTAVVVDGRTVSLSGLALGQDSAFGLTGKVVRKGSAPKAGVGRVLGTVGRALSFGLIGSGSSSTLAGAAAYGVESTAGGGLQDLDQRWRRSNKIIRVEAGTRARVYLRGDLVI